MIAGRAQQKAVNDDVGLESVVGQLAVVKRGCPFNFGHDPIGAKAVGRKAMRTGSLDRFALLRGSRKLDCTGGVAIRAGD